MTSEDFIKKLKEIQIKETADWGDDYYFPTDYWYKINNLISNYENS